MFLRTYSLSGRNTTRVRKQSFLFFITSSTDIRCAHCGFDNRYVGKILCKTFNWNVISFRNQLPKNVLKIRFSKIKFNCTNSICFRYKTPLKCCERLVPRPNDYAMIRFSSFNSIGVTSDLVLLWGGGFKTYLFL